MRFSSVAVTVALGASTAAWTIASDDIENVLQNSFVAKNQATMERLERDAVQSACSAPRGMPLDNDMLASLRAERLDAVVLPADGQYLGDWQRGAEVAGNGRGLQSSDDPTQPNGGNCYACHQLAPE